MKHIDVHSFKQVLDTEQHNSTVDFINVCTVPEYREKHIMGVRNVPLDELASHVDEFKGKQTIYIHCRSGNRGKKAIEILSSLGVSAELVNVEGGILAWDEANFSTAQVNKGKGGMPLIRQVMFVAGVMILIAHITSLLIHPSFIYLSLLVGTGLIISGLTGWCGMASILAKMPWNK